LLAFGRELLSSAVVALRTDSGSKLSGLRSAVDEPNMDRAVAPPSTACPFIDSAPFHGVISYLTGEFKTNVVTGKIVQITASSTYKPDEHVTAVSPSIAAVADLSKDTVFFFANQRSQCLCYDFNQYRVTPTHYSMRAHSSGAATGRHHSMSWVLEVCLDGMSWSVLDLLDGDGSLSNRRAVATFGI
jgi:hypothetical protein